jgi:hypothetical protein
MRIADFARYVVCSFVAAALLLCLAVFVLSGTSRASTSSEVIGVAQSGYIYGFPLVDFYRVLYDYSQNKKSPSYAAPLNEIFNTARVYTPSDTTIQTPNSDTPYSGVGLDLRAQPLVLTMPKIPTNRYYSAQLVDMYTFNIGYLGSRTTGNGGGEFLLAGPSWHGRVPPGIDKTIRFDTQLGMVIIRTQLFDPSDLSNVVKIQAGYKVQSLSSFEGKSAPPAAGPIHWIEPLTPERERSSPSFFNILAFVLQFCPLASSDEAIRTQLARVGVLPGEPFTAGDRASEFVAGMAAGQKEINAARAKNPPSSELFGTRKSLGNNYLYRALGAQFGILANSAAEAMYPSYQVDSQHRPLTGESEYTVHFAKGELPPVRAFWSLTMYDLPQQLLVKNPIDRYLINSPMLPRLKRDADGGLTLYIQHSAPSETETSNWLPAPAGAFFMVLRLYWPEETALDGTWKAPAAIRF